MFWEALWNVMAVIGILSTLTTVIFIVSVIVKSEKEDRRLFSRYFRKDDDEWL